MREAETASGAARFEAGKEYPYGSTDKPINWYINVLLRMHGRAARAGDDQPRMHGRAARAGDDQPRMHGRAVREADDQPAKAEKCAGCPRCGEPVSEKEGG